MNMAKERTEGRTGFNCRVKRVLGERSCFSCCKMRMKIDHRAAAKVKSESDECP
jgi:hypothetical protein